MVGDFRPALRNLDRGSSVTLGMRVRLAAITMLLLGAACTAVGSPTPRATPSVVPPPSGSPLATPADRVLTQAELKLRLLEELGPLWYCDPDEYPVARGDEAQLAVERFGEMQRDAEAFAAIVADLGHEPTDTFSAADKLEIYRLWKRLNAILLEPAGGGGFAFDFLTMPAAGADEGTRTRGIIDARGVVSIVRQEAGLEPACPICLARGTLIDTPAGAIPVERLRIGDPVWTIDASGRRTSGRVVAIGKVGVPSTHRVVDLVLDDGRHVRASAGHPLSDGRRLGDVRPGDLVDGARVLSARTVRYDGGATFDLLPGGPTGVYWADGLPLGSTLD
jgi:Hint domain